MWKNRRSLQTLKEIAQDQTSNAGTAVRKLVIMNNSKYVMTGPPTVSINHCFKSRIPDSTQYVVIFFKKYWYVNESSIR